MGSQQTLGNFCVSSINSAVSDEVTKPDTDLSAGDMQMLDTPLALDAHGHDHSVWMHKTNVFRTNGVEEAEAQPTHQLEKLLELIAPYDVDGKWPKNLKANFGMTVDALVK